MRADRELTIVEVLDYLDGPTLFTATDDNECRYVCSFLEDTSTCSRFLCTLTKPSVLQSFLAGNKDLRDLVETATLDPHFILETTGASEEKLMARPIRLAEIPPELLPDPGYALAYAVTESELTAKRALVEASLDVPVAKIEHVLPAETLASLLIVTQGFLHRCYRKTVANIKKPALRKERGREQYSEAQVYAFAPGSFTVKMRSTTKAGGDLFPTSPLEFGFAKASELLGNISKPETLVPILKENKGHLVGAFKRIVNFLIEENGNLSLTLVGANREENAKVFRISYEDAVRVRNTLAAEEDIEVETISLVGVLDGAVDGTGQWTLIDSDQVKHHGAKKPGVDLSLEGLVLLSKKYVFNCEEQITTDRLGKETRQLLLVNFADYKGTEEDCEQSSD